MDETMRIALEAEFDEKSAKLSDMMEKMPEMQAAYAQYEAAARALAVKEAENAAREEDAEVERMQGHCEKALSNLNAAKESGDDARVAPCQAAYEAELLAFDLAKKRQQEAYSRYEAALTQQGFESKDAYQQAFLPKPKFMKLEETIQPFRKEYAQLLARCEEIETLLSENE